MSLHETLEIKFEQPDGDLLCKVYSPDDNVVSSLSRMVPKQLYNKIRFEFLAGKAAAERTAGSNKKDPVARVVNFLGRTMRPWATS
jgi:hypothetical protein